MGHVLVFGLAGALLAATSAIAAPKAVDIRAGPLAVALAELARENGVEILYSDALVRGRAAKALRGRLSPERALSILLADSGVGYRATADGSYVLYALSPAPIDDPGDGAIAEVLVVGRRTQNADIRRTENDIQPYRIMGDRELSVAQQDNIEQLLRGRLPQNAQAGTPTQTVSAGPYTNSAINLRGAGSRRTLVLVDGRRIPGMPTTNGGLDQGDINALALGSVERIETLTATAGGIHGFSAIGGAVNVVLRRDYRGSDLAVASGVADRGDAGRVRLEGRIGFTPDDGRTNVMLAASWSAAQPFEVADRDYAARALALQTANNPEGFLEWSIPVDAVIVRSFSGEPLRLDPSLGGAELGSRYTYLPADFTGGSEALAGALAANAGQLPVAPPRGRAGRNTSLMSRPEAGSLLVNVRRRISDGVELFADGIYLTNRGHAYRPGAALGTAVHADAVSNPFAQAVVFTFPIEAAFTEARAKVEVERFTVGVIARLPAQWQASADYMFGQTTLSTRDTGRNLPNPGPFVGYGIPGPEGRPPVFPLGDYRALQSAITAYSDELSSSVRLVNNFKAGSLRAAGPLIHLPHGPLTLTVLGEIRREHMPEAEDVFAAAGRSSIVLTPDRTQEVLSAYAELRVPLVGQDTPLALARGLEAQLAVRRDEVRTTFPSDVQVGPTRGDLATIRHQADVFTIGARAFPARWLMLRASLATGEAPPDLRHLQERGFLVSFDHPDEPVDSRRGGRRVTQDGPYMWVRNGFHGLEPEKGRTLSAGLALNPAGHGRPRVSIDVSQIEVRGEVVPLQLVTSALLDMEARYPDHVVRAPLTAEDAALGYSAGRVIALHTGTINAGRSVTEMVDVQLDWTLPAIALGEVRLYGAATWQPSFRRRIQPDGPMIEVINHQDEPLKWRGNLGLEWTRGPLTLDLNVQYFGRRRLANSDASPVLISSERIAFQGSDRVPSQLYVDLAARRRFAAPAASPVRDIELRLGVQNLFDRSPPILAGPNLEAYDFHGDPRRRRFEVLLSATF